MATPLVHDMPATDEPGPLAELMAALANETRVVVPIGDLARSLGMARESAWDLCGDAEAAGLVDRWPEAPGSPGVVLAARTAVALGLVTSFDGETWIHPGDLDPRGFRVMQPFQADPDTGFVWGYDDRPDDAAIPALDAMIAAQERDRIQAEAVGRLDAPRLPRKKLTLAEFVVVQAAGDLPTCEDDEMERRRSADPSMIHFEGTAPTWPIRRVGGECGACGGRSLGFRTYCLVCDRSGIDHLLLSPPRDYPKPATVAEKIGTQARPAPKGEGPAGGTAKVEKPARVVDAAWDRAAADLAAMRSRRKRKGDQPTPLKGGVGDLPVIPV